MILPAVGCWLLLLASASGWELCADCANRRIALSDDELIKIRIEHIKEDILKKLRLKEPPKLSEEEEEGIPSALPEPLRAYRHQASEPGAPEDAQEVDNDYYGKLDQIIIFPIEKGGSWCNPSANPPSICFQFKLPAELQDDTFTTADLWLFKNNETGVEDELVLSEAAMIDIDSGANSGVWGLFTQNVSADVHGWVKTDIGTVVKKWTKMQSDGAGYNTVHVGCPTCAQGIKPPIATDKDRKPFLVLNIDEFSQNRRRKRSANCGRDTYDCCREHLNISFADIGWDEWIIEPTYYDAYFCKGSCSSISSISESKVGYHHIVKQWKLIGKDRLGRVSSCCTPNKLGELQILYKNEGGVVISKKLPNMIVEECGCS